MNTPDLIRAEIARLHAKNGGDWQTLMGQADIQYREIRYNTAQMLAAMAMRHCPGIKEVDLEWGRGTGKTTVFALFTRHVVQDLPRGSGQWIVPTYQKFLTEIIPAYIHALEMHGIYKDLHYFIGRRPPARWGWPEPYKPPIRYDHFISFWNGCGLHLLSQDIAGAGRGLSTDFEFADEAAMLDPKKMEENSTPSLRGSNNARLGAQRWFDFRLKATSTPLTKEGAWFIEREDMARHTPSSHLFLRANCVENVKMGILKPDYLSVARRTSLDAETFEAEYLNHRPRLVRGGFYGSLSERQHAYTNYDYDSYYTPELIGIQPDCRGDGDLVSDQPLVLGLDFGAAINALTVSQNLPSEFRCIKDFFGKSADGRDQDDVLGDFNRYYAPHRAVQPNILFFHDATGNHATGHTKLSKAQQFEQGLAAAGWRVRRLSITGTNPRHFEKYRLWEMILEETSTHLPRFRINRENAKYTFLSMSRAKAKRDSSGAIKKDKSSERADNPRRELATDLSDALDNPVFSLFAGSLRNMGTPLP
jgi:hypothetical protein